MVRSRIRIALLAALCVAPAQAKMIGINVLLGVEPSEEILAGLEEHGQVLDVILEINAVMMKAQDSELPAIQALPYVEAANPDVELSPLAAEGLLLPDLSAGAGYWSLDAINVTDFDGVRTVDYDGDGVYVAVLDTGLPHNWRAYFPEERIATEFARSFGGGGGQQGTVSEQPEKWEADTFGHGTWITSVLLGFAYSGPDEQLPPYFNGVAPRATIIPVQQYNNGNGYWSSVSTRAILYIGDLKASGALGDAPVVMNLSFGSSSPDAVWRAAIDYAIANGIIVVAGAGNSAGAGMGYPGAYPEVISAGATGWVQEFPSDDPTTYRWVLGDFPEGDVSAHFLAPFSSRELPGQDLDVVAPGAFVPVAWTVNGQADYGFFSGTSASCPSVAGVAALMLEQNPDLTQAEVEDLLEDTALPLPPSCAEVVWPGVGPGNDPTWSDHNNVFFFDLATCWEGSGTGSGLLQADAALEATPWP